MPVHEIRDKKGRVIGHQWGQHGKKYYGKNSAEKAGAQGRAAHANGYQE